MYHICCFFLQYRGIAISRNYNCDSFVCRYQGNCTINKTNRKRCRFCRYLKCLLTGMNLNTTRRRRQLTGISTQRQPNVGVWPVWGASNPGLGVGVGHLGMFHVTFSFSSKKGIINLLFFSYMYIIVHGITKAKNKPKVQIKKARTGEHTTRPSGTWCRSCITCTCDCFDSC